MANFKDLDSTKIGARFDGNFSDFDINVSKQMSGYFIVTRRGGYNSELVCEDCGELVFKDCVRSSDEIKELIAKKDENTEIFENKNDENSKNSSAEKSAAFSIETTQEQSPKAAFEIVDEPVKKPKKTLEIEPLVPKEPAFSIEEEKVIFEIEEEVEEEKIEEIAPITPKESIFEIQSDDEEMLENSRILEVSENSRIPQDDEKIFFAKDIELNEKNIVEIEVVIAGYDELCDSFNFLSIPNDCEYKYSIKIGELKAVFIANMTNESAKEFIRGFSFKTKRKSVKLIKIFINENSTPAFSKKLFE